jgi:hypothetical protein
MIWFIEELPPRSYVDCTVPVREDGSPMQRLRQDSEHEIYVAWLADYLHTVNLPLTPDQRAWLGTKSSPEGTMCACAEAMGYASWDLDFIERRFEDGYTSYVEFQADMLQQWEESTPLEEREEYPYVALSEEVFVRVHREWTEGKAMGVRDDAYLDFPYRPLLNWALRQIPDQEERQEQVRLFFAMYHESSSK